MVTSRVLFAVLTAALMLFVFAASVAVPLLCRPFYYAHIDALELTEKRVWTKEEMIAAYDEMLDYCLYGGEFGTGVLKWSDSGKDHFDDCAFLFRLDFMALFGSVAVLLCGFLLRKKGMRPARPCGLGVPFWGGASLLTLSAVTAALTAIDFDRAFVVFHKIFFPGKENWFFDYKTDQIILILPEAFFRNCAILVGSLMTVACVALIVADVCHKRKHLA